MKKIALVFIVVLSCLRGEGQVITTVVGSGVQGYSGDGGPATSAKLYSPSGVAVDSAGTLYICDEANCAIRKVSPAFGGTITTIAGTGSCGYSGDGGLAIYAQLSPNDLTVDRNGNIYIVDANNHRIRKVSPSGIITTIAGTGAAGYNGDGIAATAAQLNGPRGIALDKLGNIYIVDAFSHRLRKIDAGGNISTFAGTGAVGFSPDGSMKDTVRLNFIYSIAVDKHNDVFFICDSRIRKISTSSGLITTVAGIGTYGYSGDGGPATDAKIDAAAIDIDTLGNIYLAEGGNQRIRKVGSEGMIYTIAGNGTAGYSGDGGSPTLAQLKAPQGVAVSEMGDVFIGDVANNCIRAVSSHLAVEDYFSIQNEITIYPNPANTHLTITATEQINSISISNDVGGLTHRHLSC